MFRLEMVVLSLKMGDYTVGVQGLKKGAQKDG